MIMDKSSMQLLDEGKRILRLEKEALDRLENDLGENFLAAVQLILNVPGNVIFSGVGKSGHIGRKLAATFSSTGTTAFFVHADEAAHGDLGMIRKGDVFVGISFSGESDELLLILPALKKMGVPVIAMTGRCNSSLAKAASVALVTHIDREACPLNLAPTSSTTVTMALGDALAGALMVAKSFTSDDFARSHPAGALGRRLLLNVSDVMRSKDIPVVHGSDPLLDSVQIMADHHLGCIACVSVENIVEGIFTEGDLCRLLKSGVDIKSCKIADVMTKTPKVISPEEPAHAAMMMMKNNKVNTLLVVDSANKLLGIAHLQDLVAKKIS